MKLSTSISQKLKAFFSSSLLNKTYIIDTQIRKNLSTAIERYAEGTALDLGCGEMPYRCMIEKSVQRYFSLEYPGAANYFDEKIVNVSVYGDAQKIPFKSETFDTVISSEVLEHVAEPVAMINDCYRVVKEQGIFIFTVPYCYKIHMAPHDHHRFTSHGLENLLQQAGFEVVQIQCNGGNLAAIGQSLSNYLYEAFIADPLNGQPKSVLRLLIVLPLCAVVQSFFIISQRFSRVESLPLGYTVVAKKPLRKSC